MEEKVLFLYLLHHQKVSESLGYMYKATGQVVEV